MYFPYLRGRQFELIALRELLENGNLSEKVIPIIEPIKPTITLYKTLKLFNDLNRSVAVIFNPDVGSFKKNILEFNPDDNDLDRALVDVLKSKNIIKAYLANPEFVRKVQNESDKNDYLVINKNRDCLEFFKKVYKESEPKYVLMPDDRAFRRTVGNGRILLEDCFNKKKKNADYKESEDEFFTDIHLCFEEENYLGFSDYSIVGQDFSETGFVPAAVTIHMVYFDDSNEMRIRHFVSDKVTGQEDPAGKFGEALDKMIKWCDANDVPRTAGLEAFYEYYNNKNYPGLGVVKKLSIMHHIELMGCFLEGKKIENRNRLF